MFKYVLDKIEFFQIILICNGILQFSNLLIIQYSHNVLWHFTAQIVHVHEPNFVYLEFIRNIMFGLYSINVREISYVLCHLDTWKSFIKKPKIKFQQPTQHACFFYSKILSLSHPRNDL